MGNAICDARHGKVSVMFQIDLNSLNLKHNNNNNNIININNYYYYYHLTNTFHNRIGISSVHTLQPEMTKMLEIKIPAWKFFSFVLMFLL